MKYERLYTCTVVVCFGSCYTLLAFQMTEHNRFSNAVTTKQKEQQQAIKENIIKKCNHDLKIIIVDPMKLNTKSSDELFYINEIE